MEIKDIVEERAKILKEASPNHYVAIPIDRRTPYPKRDELGKVQVGWAILMPSKTEEGDASDREVVANFVEYDDNNLSIPKMSREYTYDILCFKEKQVAEDLAAVLNTGRFKRWESDS